MAPKHERTRLSFQHNPKELESLLESEEFHDIADGIAKTHPTLPLTPDVEAGRTVDGYKLIERLGSGGMGEVWRAEQGGPEKLQVAFKVILLGMNSVEVCARFNAERRALAVMDHSGIAKVYDGGSTSKGRPYFVMELVEGVRITDYATTAHLTIEECLALTIQACEALQHAHLKGIVHRDLKPSNILVSDKGGEPVIKVIDFGIAKALEGSGVDHNTTITQEGQVIGTLSYMSPEQTTQDSTQVDARSDVYSLGAILYELLAGVLPIDVSDLSKGRDEAMQLIRHQIPRRLSTHKKAARGLLRKELDWVVMKSLEKDPSRRYQSAFAFGDDLRRLLDRQPVVARPPSVSYVLSKWASRNRLALVASAVVAIVGLIVVAIGRMQVLDEITRATDRAWIQRLLEASTLDAPKVVGERNRLSAYLVNFLQPELEKHPLGSRPGMQARLAMLKHEGPRSPLAESLWQILEDDAETNTSRFHAAAVLASSAQDDDRWNLVSEDVANWLAEEPLVTPWIDYFKPISKHLSPTLENELFIRSSVRKNAAILLGAFYRDDLEGIMRLAIIADANQMPPLVNALKTHGQAAIDRLSLFLNRDFRASKSEAIRDEHALEQSRIGMALMLLGHSDKVTPHLVHPPANGDPRLKSFLIHSFAAYRVDQSVIVGFLKSQQPWMVMAGLLALGDYSLTERRKSSLIGPVRQLFHEHPDPGVHGCAKWLLKHWHQQPTPNNDGRDSPAVTRQRDPGEEQRFFVNRSGITMVVIPGPTLFTMGVPESEPGRKMRDQSRAMVIPHIRIIPRSFAIASKELTFGQYEHFRPGFLELARTPGKVTYDANIPHITEATVLDGVSLNQALRYCNWLSKTEGIPPDQWCFLVPEDREADVQLKPNFLSLEGYRLATEAEWEYACRSESVTARPYGNSEALLSKYAWFQDNSEMHAWPPGVLRPNALGLFDMLGNRSEWVHGYYVPHPAPLFGLIFDTESAVGLMPRPTSTNPHYSTRGGFSEGRAAGLRSGRRHYLADKGWATTIRVARTIGAEHSQKR